ncbi:MAG: S8 family serine peptidase [Actinobacteria bacterium]|nr:S8 family serine peptidase [Actinomycetota bacterium]
MRQIKQPQANAITGGSPAVVVGDIDTGVDKDHPDLVQNIDFSRSASCEFGIPNQAPAAWDDHNGHGTHTTGTMAAAANGFGITGVAPNVRIAATKSSNDDGYFFVDMVVCSFMWAGGAAIDIRRRRAWTSPRPSGRAWTSRTTATSWIPGSTTAGTMLASGCCGRPPSARSTSRSRGVSPTSPRRATRATTSRIPRSTTGAPTRVPLRNVTSRMPVS